MWNNTQLLGSQEILFFVALFIVQLCCLRASQAFSFLSVNGGELELPPEARVQEVFLCGGMKINGNSSFSHFQHSKQASARRGDRQTRAANRLLRSPNSPVLMEKVPLEILLSQNFNGLAKRLHRPSGGSIISQKIGCWKGFIVGDACCFDYTHISCLESSVMGKKRFSLSCAVRFMLALDIQDIQPKHKDNSTVCWWCHALDGRTVYSVWKLGWITSGFNIRLSPFVINAPCFCVRGALLCQPANVASPGYIDSTTYA